MVQRDARRRREARSGRRELLAIAPPSKPVARQRLQLDASRRGVPVGTAAKQRTGGPARPGDATARRPRTARSVAPDTSQTRSRPSDARHDARPSRVGPEDEACPPGGRPRHDLRLEPHAGSRAGPGRGPRRAFDDRPPQDLGRLPQSGRSALAAVAPPRPPRDRSRCGPPGDRDAAQQPAGPQVDDGDPARGGLGDVEPLWHGRPPAGRPRERAVRSPVRAGRRARGRPGSTLTAAVRPGAAPVRRAPPVEGQAGRQRRVGRPLRGDAAPAAPSQPAELDATGREQCRAGRGGTGPTGRGRPAGGRRSPSISARRAAAGSADVGGSGRDDPRRGGGKAGMRCRAAAARPGHDGERRRVSGTCQRSQRDQSPASAVRAARGRANAERSRNPSTNSTPSTWTATASSSARRTRAAERPALPVRAVRRQRGEVLPQDQLDPAPDGVDLVAVAHHDADRDRDRDVLGRDDVQLGGDQPPRRRGSAATRRSRPRSGSGAAGLRRSSSGKTTTLTTPAAGTAGVSGWSSAQRLGPRDPGDLQGELAEVVGRHRPVAAVHLGRDRVQRLVERFARPGHPRPAAGW